MDSDSESDSDSQQYVKKQEIKGLRRVFEPYFNKILNSSGFIKHMNQRCTGTYDSTSYILLCEAIQRNDNRNAISLLRYYCKANMGNLDPSKDIPLQLAILAGNVEIVELLLSKGARANISFENQWKPLHLICDKESTSIPSEETRIVIASLLLKHKADIDAVEIVNKDTPLILAVRNKFFKLTEFLLNNGSNKLYMNQRSETAFHVAFSENAGIDMIRLLYDNNLDLDHKDHNNCTVLSYAVKNLMNSVYGSFYGLSQSLTPVQFLLNHGVSVNSILDKSDNRILHVICQNNAAQTMKIFLDYGADVNVKNIDGMTPLHFCAEYQPINYINLLFSSGADVNALTNDNQSVLHFAAANKHHEVLQRFLKYNLDMNAKSRGGMFTPLFNAVWSNRQKNVQLLLDRQANVNERTINNQIVLHVAIDQNHVEMIDILLEYGSDINISDDYGNTTLSMLLYRTLEVHRNTGLDWSKESIHKKIVKHAAVLYLSNQYLSTQSQRILSTPSFQNFFMDCINELNFMKNTNVIDNVTFFDIIAESKYKLVTYMRRENCINAFNDKEYKKKFPIYHENIDHKVRSTIVRVNLLKKSAVNIIRIIQNIGESWVDVYFPTLIVDHILSYFSITDLENLSVIYGNG